jgi:hypothetical protein
MRGDDEPDHRAVGVTHVAQPAALDEVAHDHHDLQLVEIADKECRYGSATFPSVITSSSQIARREASLSQRPNSLIGGISVRVRSSGVDNSAIDLGAFDRQVRRSTVANAAYLPLAELILATDQPVKEIPLP